MCDLPRGAQAQLAQAQTTAHGTRMQAGLRIADDETLWTRMTS